MTPNTLAYLLNGFLKQAVAVLYCTSRVTDAAPWAIGGEREEADLTRHYHAGCGGRPAASFRDRSRQVRLSASIKETVSTSPTHRLMMRLTTCHDNGGALPSQAINVLGTTATL